MWSLLKLGWTKSGFDPSLRQDEMNETKWSTSMVNVRLRQLLRLCVASKVGHRAVVCEFAAAKSHVFGTTIGTTFGTTVGTNFWYHFLVPLLAPLFLHVLIR